VRLAKALACGPLLANFGGPADSDEPYRIGQVAVWSQAWPLSPQRAQW
jgi:hypothetical protein